MTTYSVSFLSNFDELIDATSKAYEALRAFGLVIDDMLSEEEKIAAKHGLLGEYWEYRELLRKTNGNGITLSQWKRRNELSRLLFGLFKKGK